LTVDAHQQHGNSDRYETEAYLGSANFEIVMVTHQHSHVFLKMM
jgi:hypothetical protein